MTALDAVAGTATSGDERGIDARRADALVAVMTRALDAGVGPDGPLPTRQHRRPHLHVTAAATTLLGLDEAPAELAGFGPIPADMARRIAATSTWRPVLTHHRTGELLARSPTVYQSSMKHPSSRTGPPLPTGPPSTSDAPVITDLRSTTYRPGAALAGLVMDRDVTCTFPGCRVPAVRCDIDHIVPFDPSRPAAWQTRPENLHLLCRHHHRMKTLGRWKAQRDPRTGATRWTSPTGHVYTRIAVPTDPSHPPVDGRSPEAPGP